MSSNEKPPLPTGISISEKRPELFCLNFKHTEKICNEYNRNRDIENQKILDDFDNKFIEWKQSSI